MDPVAAVGARGYRPGADAMDTLTLLSPILLGFALPLAAWWLERRTRHVGLFFALTGGLLVLVGGYLFVARPHWLPAVLVAQGLISFYWYRWRRSRRTVGE